MSFTRKVVGGLIAPSAAGGTAIATCGPVAARGPPHAAVTPVADAGGLRRQFDDRGEVGHFPRPRICRSGRASKPDHA